MNKKDLIRLINLFRDDIIGWANIAASWLAAEGHKFLDKDVTETSFGKIADIEKENVIPGFHKLLIRKENQFRECLPRWIDRAIEELKK